LAVSGLFIWLFRALFWLFQGSFDAPTCAALRAPQSLAPSPHMPTMSPCACAARSRLVRCGQGVRRRRWWWWWRWRRRRRRRRWWWWWYYLGKRLHKRLLLLGRHTREDAREPEHRVQPLLPRPPRTLQRQQTPKSWPCHRHLKIYPSTVAVGSLDERDDIRFGQLRSAITTPAPPRAAQFCCV